jgi:4-methyl-5(b-hydroxyethyl)-thiazole monophosphate biosynthesis
MSKRVLCLLVAGFEEIETVTPVDLLRRAGAEVVLASVTGDSIVKGRCGMGLQADASLADVMNDTFDLLLIPGGPGVKALRTDGRAAELAKRFNAAAKPIGAICAAPTVLADASLLEHRRYTAHFSVNDELPRAMSGARVVEDDGLITSRGAGTALEFGLALVKRLFGDTRAREIAESVMA